MEQLAMGMGGGWIVLFSKSEEQPQLRKLTRRNVAGTRFGDGEDKVVALIEGLSKTVKRGGLQVGLRWATASYRVRVRVGVRVREVDCR